MSQIFDSIAETYDGWYEKSEGRAIFNAELKCLRSLCANCRGRWLEAGVGTGRFAFNLGIDVGVDPSMPMLGIAKNRGIRVSAGRAEALPFPEHSFDGVLLALALCFMEDPSRALQECARVMRPEGRLVLGVIPAESVWGRVYEIKKAEGHPVYASARFLNAQEIVSSIETIGFVCRGAASTLFWAPDTQPDAEPLVKDGFSPDAGFLGLLFKKTDDIAA